MICKQRCVSAFIQIQKQKAPLFEEPLTYSKSAPNVGEKCHLGKAFPRG